LAEAGPQPTEARRKNVVAHAMKEVAELLGNTPAVARASYVDPRVIEHFAAGDVVAEGSEHETLDLLVD
jgi:DNA topoisomerase IB